MPTWGYNSDNHKDLIPVQRAAAAAARWSSIGHLASRTCAQHTAVEELLMRPAKGGLSHHLWPSEAAREERAWRWLLFNYSVN